MVNKNGTSNFLKRNTCITWPGVFTTDFIHINLIRANKTQIFSKSREIELSRIMPRIIPGIHIVFVNQRRTSEASIENRKPKKRQSTAAKQTNMNPSPSPIPIRHPIRRRSLPSEKKLHQSSPREKDIRPARDSFRNAGLSVVSERRAWLRHIYALSRCLGGRVRARRARAAACRRARIYSPKECCACIPRERCAAAVRISTRAVFSPRAAREIR